MQKIVNIITLLFSATLLITGDSYRYIPALLGVISLLALPFTFTVNIDKEIKKIMLAFLCFVSLTLVSLLLYGGKMSQADMPSRILLGIPALFLLIKYPPKLDWLLTGVIIGSYIAGAIALYFFLVLHMRAFHGYDYFVIQAGNIAMSLGIFSLLGSLYYLQLNKKAIALLALAGAFLGVFASVLSGARGGWIISPLVLLAALYINRDLLSKKVQWVAMLLLIAIAVCSYPLIKKRVVAVEDDLQRYSKQQANSSSGVRLELWKSGLYSLADKPIFGQGYDGIKIAKKKQVAEGKVDSIILNFARAHNNYLEEASIKGGLGLTALLAIFLLPLRYLYQNYRQSLTPEGRFIAQLGMAHIVLVMGYCLTQNYLNHHTGILQFIVYTVLLLAMSSAQQKKHNRSSDV